MTMSLCAGFKLKMTADEYRAYLDQCEISAQCKSNRRKGDREKRGSDAHVWHEFKLNVAEDVKWLRASGFTMIATENCLLLKNVHMVKAWSTERANCTTFVEAIALFMGASLPLPPPPTSLHSLAD